MGQAEKMTMQSIKARSTTKSPAWLAGGSIASLLFSVTGMFIQRLSGLGTWAVSTPISLSAAEEVVAAVRMALGAAVMPIEPGVAACEEHVVLNAGGIPLEQQHRGPPVAEQPVALTGEEIEQHTARVLDGEIFGDVAPVQRPGVDDLVAEAVDEPDGLAGGELDRSAAARMDFREIQNRACHSFLAAVSGSAVEILHHLQRQAGLHILDARHLQQDIEGEAAIGLQVAGEDMQEIIHLAGHDIAADDLGMAQHRLAERLVEAVLVALQADLDEGLDAEAQMLAVEPGDIAADGAAGFELLGAAEARRGGEADALGEIDIGDPAFFLEYAQDPEIRRIEGGLGHIMPAYRSYLAENAGI